MECMEAKALKPSLRSELTQQEFMDEVYYATTAAPTGISYVAGEDFFVDELLNLQNVEFEDGYVEEEEEEEEEDEGEEKDSLSIEEETSNLSGENPVAGDFESPLTSELAVPDDDIAELEWVSHFVDDSLFDFSLLHPLGKQRIETNRSEPEPRRTGKTVLCFPPVPARPRTKRARPTTRPPAPSQLTESSLSSSSSSSSAFFAFPSASCRISFLSKTVGEPASKKQKKKPVVESGSGSIGAQFQRRCSHCQVQKTPQWRAGPLGAKTLCNACGVRFNSGRLFPEYRPACSPTFCSDVHSNRHQKVLEMRKKREIVEPSSGLAQVISSNCF